MHRRFRQTIPAALIRAAAAAGDGESFTATITTGAVDRYRDIIPPERIDTAAYERNPVVLFGHDSKQPIGRALALTRTAAGIVAEFTLASTAKAREVATLIREGVLSAVSIGFDAIDPPVWNEARGGFDFGATELLEFSVVAVPANPHALIARAIELSPEGGTTMNRTEAIRRAAELRALETRTAEQDAELATCDAIIAAPEPAPVPPTRAVGPAISTRAPRYNAGRILDLAGNGRPVDGFEREVSDALSELATRQGCAERPGTIRILPPAVLRAMDGITTGAGATLNPATFIDRLSQLLIETGTAIWPELTMARLGARVVPVSQYEAQVPTQTARPTAATYAVDAAITAGPDAKFAMASVKPVSAAVLVEFKRSANYATDPAATAIVLGQLSQAVATEIDRCGLHGNVAPAVVGLLAGATPSGVTVTLDDSGYGSLAAVKAALVAYLKQSDVSANRWAMSPATIDAFATVASFPGALASPYAFFVAPNGLYGSTVVPALVGDAIGLYGDFSTCAVLGFALGSIALTLNPYADSVFASGGFLARVISDYNVHLVDPSRVQSFIVAAPVA